MYYHKILTTALGAGYTPIAPGTAGAIVGCIIYWLLWQLGLPYGEFQLLIIILTVLFTILGAYSAKALEPQWGKDPSKIVIDEVIGVWINLLFVPFSLINILLGFILFRVFDIWKPLGIRKMEKIDNGWGVMLDDVLAGVYGNIVLQIILIVWCSDMQVCK